MSNLAPQEMPWFDSMNLSTSFDWSQPLRRTEHLSDALSFALMNSGLDSGYVNIFRDEQEDFCGISVFETIEEAVSVGSGMLDSFDEMTILFQTNAIRISPC